MYYWFEASPISHTKEKVTHRACVLVRISVAIKRHHDHNYSYKEKHLIEVAAYSSEVQSIVLVGTCRQIW